MTGRGRTVLRRPGVALCALAVVYLLLCSIPFGVYAFTNDQAATTVIGQTGFTSSTAAATATGLNGPGQMAFDSSGNLWVADSVNNRVLEYKAPFSDGEAASLVIGQPSLTSSSAATTATGLSNPIGVAFDPSGNLWVADTFNNRVLEYKAPFSDDERASVVIGQTSFTSATPGSFPTTASSLDSPWELTFDSSGNLWVADEGNSRVLEYKAPFSDGEAASLVIGQPSFAGGAVSTTATGLSEPFGLTFDAYGNLWVADTVNHRVLEYKAPFSDDERASVVIGQTSFTSSTAATTATGLWGPSAAAFDPSGNLWVVDGLVTNRVLEYKAPFSDGEAASVVIGQTSFTSSTAATTATGLNGAFGVTFDSSGNLWVSDSSNDRVLEYATTPYTCTGDLIFCGHIVFPSLGPSFLGCPPICTVPQGTYELDLAVNNPAITSVQLDAAVLQTPNGPLPVSMTESCVNQVCGPYDLSLTPGIWTLTFTSGSPAASVESITFTVQVTPSGVGVPEFPGGPYAMSIMLCLALILTYLIRPKFKPSPMGS